MINSKNRQHRGPKTVFTISIQNKRHGNGHIDEDDS